jgi:hypothetical protein
MKNLSALVILPASVLLAFLTPVSMAGQQIAGSNWARVLQTDPGTVLRISSQRSRTICSFIAADETSLTCSQTRTYFFFPVRQRLLFTKQEITSIKLSRRPLSILAGAAIGAGAGAGIGAAIDASAKNQVEEGHLVTVLGTLFGFGIGAGVGSSLDFLAGPTLYRAP